MYKSFKNRTKRTKRTKKRKMKGGNVKNIEKTEQGYKITYGRSIIHLPKLEDIQSMSKLVSPIPISIFRAVGLGCENEDYVPMDDEKAKTFFQRRDSPVVFFKYKCRKPYSGRVGNIMTTLGTVGSIVSTSVAKTPLINDTFLFEFINEIIQQSKETIVFVFGHSFGGLMINRIAEIFIKIYRYVVSTQDPTIKEVLDAIKEVLDIIFSNVFFAGFGSVYIPSEVREEKIPINIMNYTAVGDVSNTCTRGVHHKQRVNHKTICSFKEITGLPTVKYLPRVPTSFTSHDFNMIDLCFMDEHNNPTCTNHINNIPILRAGNEWEIHNSYDRLIHILLINRTNNIEHVR